MLKRIPKSLPTTRIVAFRFLAISLQILNYQQKGITCNKNRSLYSRLRFQMAYCTAKIFWGYAKHFLNLPPVRNRESLLVYANKFSSISQSYFLISWYLIAITIFKLIFISSHESSEKEENKAGTNLVLLSRSTNRTGWFMKTYLYK